MTPIASPSRSSGTAKTGALPVPVDLTSLARVFGSAEYRAHGSALCSTRAPCQSSSRPGSAEIGLRQSMLYRTVERFCRLRYEARLAVLQREDAGLVAIRKARCAVSTMVSRTGCSSNLSELNDVEHIAGRGLLFERLLQLALARLHLLEQPRVLDGDDGLVGEGSQQLDLLSVNGRTSGAQMAMTPIGSPSSQHRHARASSGSPELLLVRSAVPSIARARLRRQRHGLPARSRTAPSRAVPTVDGVRLAIADQLRRASPTVRRNAEAVAVEREDDAPYLASHSALRSRRWHRTLAAARWASG